MSYNDNELRQAKENRKAIENLRDAVDELVEKKKTEKARIRDLKKENESRIQDLADDVKAIARQSGIPVYVGKSGAPARKYKYQKRLDERDDWERFNFFVHPSMRPENRHLNTDIHADDCTTRYLDE